MKFGKKTFLFFAAFIALVFFCSNVSAVSESDLTGDVWVHQLGGSGMSYREYSGSRDNVDITSVSYELSDSTVTASLTVAGEIVNDMYHTYIIYLENPSGQYYATYSAGSGMWIGTDKYGGEWGQLTDPISGDTFTAIFEINHPEDNFELYGSATESVDATEAYYDYAPNTYAPYYEGTSNDETDSNESENTQNGEDQTVTEGETDTGSENTEDNVDSDGDTGSDTPGFEILTAIAAISIALILLKKRR